MADGPQEDALSVTVVTEYYHPEEASTAQLLTELTTDLADGGFDVSVVTARPNYHPDDRSASVPRHEIHDGVDVRRVPATRFDKDVLPLRIVNWLTFTLLAAAALLWRHRDADAVLVLSNPPILPAAAWLHKRVTGTPYAYLVYDVYPDMAVALGLLDDGLVVRAWERAMRVVYADADRVIVLGESMRRTVAEKVEAAGGDPDKIRIVPNWEDSSFVEPMSKVENAFAREHGTVEPFTLVYSGNVGRFHDLETAVDAIAELEDRGRRDVELLIIGEGAKKNSLQRRVRDRGVEGVSFLPFQPLERLPESLTCGDASLVTVERGVEGLCVSSKLYSSLAAGRPVLALVGPGDEVARVVENCDCGARVDQGDADAVADVLARWADDPELADRLGRNARECLLENYTREHAVKAYAELLAGLDEH